ncbi:CARTF-like protein [Mya arenaria]|uniref:CARTF-like protein n=1 Tax=Mya arenaria TaxID=6604 RepID=A0ABY7F5M8_MYAAR|nr:CARTF-like protein [Mya arenaria]
MAIFGSKKMIIHPSIQNENRVVGYAYRVQIADSFYFCYLAGSIKHSFFWREHSCDSNPISYDGVPFIIVGKQRRECFHVPDRNRGKKKKNEDRKKVDHPYEEKGRKLVQPSHKRNCPAFIMLRYIVRFPVYKIHSDSNYQRRTQIDRLKIDLQNKVMPVLEHRVYCSTPESAEHKYHVRGEFGSTFQPLDKVIINRIKALVAEGIRSVSEMKRHLRIFAKQNFPGVSELSNRYFPSNKDIRNHMSATLRLDKYSDEDQENLRLQINQWQTENPQDNFHYIPSAHAGSSSQSDGLGDHIEEFIFVHQNSDQKRLLAKYGHEICLLDATYKTTKYDLPLFFVSVNTNVGYMVVGSFIVPSESSYNIGRGLQVLKAWNPSWNPTYFMTDYDRNEINAIENTFPGCFTYLCDFHREQAWQRWVGPSNGITESADLLKVYVQYNIKSIHKKYTSEVPRFLHCKPKVFVDHCLGRLPTPGHPTSISAEVVGPRKFKVTSYDSDRGPSVVIPLEERHNEFAAGEDENSHAVQLLWDLPRNFDIPVAKVNGTTVTDTDIRSLQSPEWLTDNIIDAYLHMLCVELTEGKVGGMLNIDRISMNAIMNKTFRPRNPPNIYEYMFVVGAYCRAAHWTLVILDVEEKKVFFYIPYRRWRCLNVEPSRKQCVFLTGCCPKCGMTVDDGLETIPCADCGRSYHFTNYCVEADVEGLGDGERFRCTLCRINYWESVSRGPKKPVGPKLLAEKTPTCCLCTEPHDERQYWECDKCGSRLHPGCIGRDPDETPADSSTAFWCEACLTAVVKVWPVDNCKEFIESGGLSDDSNLMAAETRGIPEIPEEIYSKHHIIDGIENKEFANLFNEEFGLAECYVSKVLQKEAMIAILQMHSAVGYQEADSRLKEAESNSNRAMLAGLLINTGEIPD